MSYPSFSGSFDPVTRLVAHLPIRFIVGALAASELGVHQRCPIVGEHEVSCRDPRRSFVLCMQHVRIAGLRKPGPRMIFPVNTACGYFPRVIPGVMTTI